MKRVHLAFPLLRYPNFERAATRGVCVSFCGSQWTPPPHPKPAGAARPSRSPLVPAAAEPLDASPQPAPQNAGVPEGHLQGFIRSGQDQHHFAHLARSPQPYKMRATTPRTGPTEAALAPTPLDPSGNLPMAPQETARERQTLPLQFLRRPPPQHYSMQAAHPAHSDYSKPAHSMHAPQPVHSSRGVESGKDRRLLRRRLKKSCAW